MENIIEVENLIIQIRDQKILVDKNIAQIYGVKTKRINEVVKNNIDKFPNDYMFELNDNEKNELVVKNDRFNNLKHSVSNIKVFTENIS